MAEIIPHRIVISRTDSIGDVILTLPMAGILRKKFPEAEIIFLGNTYTKPIIACCEYVDEIWEWAAIEQLNDQQRQDWLVHQGVDTFIHVFPRKDVARLAKKAKVRHRIGTSHRAFHLRNCNHTVNFTRKRSELHEAQLNMKLLEPLGIKEELPLAEITAYLGFTRIPALPSNLESLIDKSKESVILHPKSNGSAIEWGIDNFMELAVSLNPDKYQVFFTGTEQEAVFFRHELPKQRNMVDLSGRITLRELISFIAHSNHLVAASTGPLHIAGASEIHAIGLFTNQRPMHPGRWLPLGNKVTVIKPEKESSTTQPLIIQVRDVRKGIERF